MRRLKKTINGANSKATQKANAVATEKYAFNIGARRKSIVAEAAAAPFVL